MPGCELDGSCASHGSECVSATSIRRDQDDLDAWDFGAHAGGSGQEVRCQPGHFSHLYARIGAFRSFAKCFLRMARNADSARHRCGYTIFEHGHTATCPHARRAHLAHSQTDTMVSHLTVILPLGMHGPAADMQASPKRAGSEAATASNRRVPTLRPCHGAPDQAARNWVSKCQASASRFGL